MRLGRPWTLAIEQVFTMCPPSASIISGTSALQTRKCPVRFTSSMRRQSSSECSGNGFTIRLPALLASTSRVPKRSETAFAIADTSEDAPISAVNAKASPPDPSIKDTVSAAPWALHRDRSPFRHERERNRPSNPHGAASNDSLFPRKAHPSFSPNAYHVTLAPPSTFNYTPVTNFDSSHAKNSAA